MVRATLLKLVVLKSWKGSYRPGDVIDTWTPYWGESCGYTGARVGAQVVVFSDQEKAGPIFSCATSAPDAADVVSTEIESIVRGKTVGGDH
jgi:hypothetical protein